MGKPNQRSPLRNAGAFLDMQGSRLGNILRSSGPRELTDLISVVSGERYAAV